MPKAVKKAATFLLYAVLIWLAGFVLFVASIFLSKPQDEDKITDAIVVLTGGDTRVDSGLELFAAGRAEHLFITGVHPDVQRHEIEALWKGETALPPCCITLGYKARTTTQNAQEVREWLEDRGYDSIRLVTADFHMNRSLIEFRHSMPDIEIIAHPIRQRGPAHAPKHWFWAMTVLEYNKTLVRWLSLIASPRPIPVHEDHKGHH
jgi:uncharacterized SAM-binding protein YcdF (DUF218 family)